MATQNALRAARSVSDIEADRICWAIHQMIVRLGSYTRGEDPPSQKSLPGRLQPGALATLHYASRSERAA